jgi:hypothetical protein
MKEYEYEPVRGLPEDLPEGETIVWQGTPDWRSLAWRAFHVRKVILYFAVLLGWLLFSQWRDGAGGAALSSAASWTFSLAACAVAILLLLAWANARSAVYTLTNRRLVLRFGVALPMMINLPLQKLQSAGLVTYGKDLGDIALTLVEGERASYLALWPHVRPWHFARPQPMLRGISGARTVAALLAQQVADTAADSTVAVDTASLGDRDVGAFDPARGFEGVALSN